MIIYFLETKKNKKISNNFISNNKLVVLQIIYAQ
jgi:hypothetical protein